MLLDCRKDMSARFNEDLKELYTNDQLGP